MNAALPFSSSWTRNWQKPDYSWCSLDVIKPSAVGKNVPGHDILILIVWPLPQELIFPYLWIQQTSFWRVFWESRCLRFGLTTPHYHVGQRGFRAHESTWSGPLPQAAVAVFCLPRTSELLSLIALHGRKHRYVGRKVGGMLDAYMEGGRKHSEIIKVQNLDRIEGPWSCHPLIWKLHLFHKGLFFGSCVSGLKSPIVAFLFCSFEPLRPFFPLNKSQILFDQLSPD